MSRPAQITRRLEFDAGHRLLGHESKCRNLHGHRYTVELTVEAAELDHVGRVIDFGVVKAIVGGWIDEHLDHGYIGEAEDPILAAARAAGLKVHGVSFPPTAEHLARYLFDVASNLLGGSYKIRVARVTLFETPNGRADYPNLAGRNCFCNACAYCKEFAMNDENPHYTPPRRVEVKRGDTWIRTTFPELSKGDHVRMFEEDGEPADGGEVWVCAGPAEERPELPGRYKIQTWTLAEYEAEIQRVGGAVEELLSTAEKIPWEEGQQRLRASGDWQAAGASMHVGVDPGREDE